MLKVPDKNGFFIYIYSALQALSEKAWVFF